MYSRRLLVILLLIFSGGCSFKELTTCQLPCQLGVDQANPLTVQNFLDPLTIFNWIQVNPERVLRATYARDTFSNVLETTVSIELDGAAAPFYISDINLYIGYIGSINPDHESIPYENIEAIQLNTHIPVFLSWLLYGLPEGGRILPFYLAGDLDETNPCPGRSHYIAYYDGGNFIIRAVIDHPILLNLWTAPIEIVYPIGENELEFSSRWIGQFERMDHIPCMFG